MSIPLDVSFSSQSKNHKSGFFSNCFMSGNEQNMKPDVLVALVGPTGVGKSEISLRIAPSLQAEIVSIDSAQVFQKLDVGTSKATPDQRRKVPHHLIDILPPDQEITVAFFQERAEKAIKDIQGRGKIPLLVGGSGLYYRAVVDRLSFPGIMEDRSLRDSLEELAGDTSSRELHDLLKEFDPVAARDVHPNNTRRVIRALEVAMSGGQMSRREKSWEQYHSTYQLTSVGLEMERAVLYKITDKRVDRMVEEGLVDEVRRLQVMGMEEWPNASQIIGYSQILDYLKGKYPLEQAIEKIKRRTRNLVKRQYTWFKKDPRIKWFKFIIEGADDADALCHERARLANVILEYIRSKTEN